MNEPPQLPNGIHRLRICFTQMLNAIGTKREKRCARNLAEALANYREHQDGDNAEINDMEQVS